MKDAAIPVFLNPTAGRGRAEARIPVVKALFEEQGIPYELILSKRRWDIEQRIRQVVADGAERVIVAGGDGSVHEAFNGILSSTGKAALGIIPIGTGNDFIKAAGIPLDWQLAIRELGARLRDGIPPRTIDAGRMNDRYFANGAGVGFDAKINRLSQNIRWKIGDLVYLIGVGKGLIDGVITPEVSMTYDDGEYQGPITLANVCNGSWIGGMFHIAPMADNADGKLDLIYVDPVTRLQVAGLVPKLIRGTHIGERQVHHRRVTKVVIHASEPVPAHMDGEVVPMGIKFEIQVLPSALQLL